MKRTYRVMIICWLLMTNVVFGCFAFIEPKELVRGSDLIVIAQIVDEMGMVNIEEVAGRDNKRRFTADTEWKIEVYDILKDITNSNWAEGYMHVVTPGAKEATIHMSTDFILGEIDEYVLLFLTEQVNENNEVYYSLGSMQSIIKLKQVYKGDRDRTLQVNNIKNDNKEDKYYTECFDEIKRWATNLEKNKPIYICEGIYENKYEIEAIIKQNTTYIALKDLEHVLGIIVDWDAKTKSITIRNFNYGLMETEKKVIELTPNSRLIKVNGLEEEIGYAPILVEGKSYLPMREITKLLGNNISYKKQSNIHTYKIS